MLYCVAIAILFVVVGEALERALHLAGRATRWAWVVALAGSYLVPAAALLRPNTLDTLPIPLTRPAAIAPTRVQPVDRPLLPPARSFSLGDLDAALTWAWGLSAGAVALALVGAGLRLAAWRRRWRVTTLDGRTGLVSENVGPAVAGLWRPPVVLPPRTSDLRRDDHRRLRGAANGRSQISDGAIGQGSHRIGHCLCASVSPGGVCSPAPGHGRRVRVRCTGKCDGSRRRGPRGTRSRLPRGGRPTRTSVPRQRVVLRWMRGSCGQGQGGRLLEEAEAGPGGQ